MPSGGKLTISTFNEKNKVVCTFTDSGIGMADEIRTRIFQPLFTTKERGRGTGLGLVVVNRILSEHNAVIEVESEINKGAKFIISFETE
jgi:two-component system, NtrC family, sensor kinase